MTTALALAAIAIIVAAVCLWAWPALEAHEAKQRKQERDNQTTEQLTPSLTAKQIVDRADKRGH